MEIAILALCLATFLLQLMGFAAGVVVGRRDAKDRAREAELVRHYESELDRFETTIEQYKALLVGRTLGNADEHKPETPPSKPN